MTNNINTWSSLPPSSETTTPQSPPALRLPASALLPFSNGNGDNSPSFQAQRLPIFPHSPVSAASLLFPDDDEKKVEAKAPIPSSHNLPEKKQPTAAKPIFEKAIDNEWLELAHNPAPADQITWCLHLEMANVALFRLGNGMERESCHTILPYTLFEIKAKQTLLPSADHTYLHAPMDIIKQSLEIYREKYTKRRNQVALLIRSICKETALETLTRETLDQHIATLQTMLKEMCEELNIVKSRHEEVADQYIARGASNIFTQQWNSTESIITIPNFFDPETPHSFSREDDGRAKMQAIAGFYMAYSAILDECKEFIEKCIARTQELTHYLENGRRFYPQN